MDTGLCTSEDHLLCLKAEPLIRNRPLSDTYPFQSQRERNAVPYLLSTCGAQVQPVTAGSLSEENRLNSINSSAWSKATNPAQPDRNPPSSRIMRLFSNSRKGPIPAPCPTLDSPTAANSSEGGGAPPHSWSGLTGMAVMDSFKKLRSSVLLGIQNRESTDHRGQTAPPAGQNAVETEPHDATHPSKVAEGYRGSDANVTGQDLAGRSQCVVDMDDYDDDEEEIEEGDGLQRNSLVSRSIRRAYGAGRISLLDIGKDRLSGSGSGDAANGQKADQRSPMDENPEPTRDNPSVNVLSRLSKSAENLHIFKAPFRRKALTPGASTPQADSQRTSTSNGTAGIQRAASTSFVDFRGHAGPQPVKTKGQMLMLDLGVRRRRSPSPSPTSPSPMSPLCRLHDDYSRRVPCLTTSERQRRPSPVRARVTSAEHVPLIHPQPERVVSPQRQVLLSAVCSEGAGQTASEQTAECDSCSHDQKEPSQSPDQTEVSTLKNQVRIWIQSFQF